MPAVVLVLLAGVFAGAGGLAAPALARHGAASGNPASPVNAADGTIASTGPAPATHLASAATEDATLLGSATSAGAVAVSVTVPMSGSFTVTVAAGPVTLQPTTTPLTLAGTLQDITVAETRNWAPGWSVTGQESDFTGGGRQARHAISGTEFGWIPVGTVTGGAALGPAVAPGSPGVGETGAVLAMGAPGSGVGTDTLSATLLLHIPAALTRACSGILTITYMEVGSQPTASGQPLFPPAR